MNFPFDCLGVTEAIAETNISRITDATDITDTTSEPTHSTMAFLHDSDGGECSTLEAPPMSPISVNGMEVEELSSSRQQGMCSCTYMHTVNLILNTRQLLS